MELYETRADLLQWRIPCRLWWRTHGFEFNSNFLGDVFDLRHDEVAKIVRRQNSVGIAGVDTRWLDVLHDANNVDIFAVADGIGLGLNSTTDKMV